MSGGPSWLQRLGSKKICSPDRGCEFKPWLGQIQGAESERQIRILVVEVSSSSLIELVDLM